MAILDDETRDNILIQTALLAAKTAETVAGLIEATQPKLGQFGGTIERPTPIETGGLLRLDADALRRLLPEDADPLIGRSL